MKFELRIEGDDISVLSNKALSLDDKLRALSKMKLQIKCDEASYDEVFSINKKGIISIPDKYKVVNKMIKGSLVLTPKESEKYFLRFKFATYLVKDVNTGHHKIGRSSDVDKRMKSLRSENPSIELIATCPVDIERDLHVKYASKRVVSEWFNLSNDDVNHIVNYEFEV